MLDQYSQPEQLLADDSFLNWYFKTGDGRDQAWEEWMRADAGRQELVQQAIELLELARLPEKQIPAEQIQRAEARLMAGIGGTEIGGTGIDRLETRMPTGAGQVEAKTLAGIDKEEEPSPVIRFSRSRQWVAAACFLGVLVTGMLLYKAFHGRSAIRTEFGQLRQQVLPDGTEVTMNANSRLQFAPDWKTGADREVWMSGEAFFHVSKTPEKSRFIVHLDHGDVIVTGTRFNVVNRPGKENVMLEEGAVTLRASCGEVINMHPGDFVVLDKDRAENEKVRPDSLMAWTKRTLFFDNTPLRDLVNIVYEQYGVRIQLAGDSPEDKTVSGILPNDDLESLLKALPATGQFEVSRQEGGAITITARPLQK
jgi:transmembrane sensor